MHYGGDDIHFDPGSSCLNILDAGADEPRLAVADDLVRLVQLTETLPQFAAQSTALVCDDAPEEIGDIYRLLLVLWYSAKPVVTGAFSAETLRVMIDLLVAESGSREASAAASARGVRCLPVASAELGRIWRAEPGGSRAVLDGTPDGAVALDVVLDGTPDGAVALDVVLDGTPDGPWPSTSSSVAFILKVDIGFPFWPGCASSPAACGAQDAPDHGRGKGSLRPLRCRLDDTGTDGGASGALDRPDGEDAHDEG